MNRYLVILIVVLTCNCTTQTEKENTLALVETHTDAVNAKNNPHLYSVFNKPDLDRELYAVKLSVGKHKNGLNNLIIDMRLKDGGHFVSPNAKRDFSGKFNLVVDKTTEFNLIGNLIESPLSVEEIDPHPFVKGPINWVRENTTYTQQIKRNTTNDFEVKGFIQFTIEPACTLEKLPFIIKQTNGILKLEFYGCIN